MNYSIYKFYKGETKCPEKFNAEENRLWNAEREFEDDFSNNDSADWYDFFIDYELDGNNAGDIFMKNLDNSEHDKPKILSKKWIYDLWLKCFLLVDKIPENLKELATHKFNFVKFYNNENVNPFLGKDQNKAMLWEYERLYTLNSDDRECLKEYLTYMKEFRNADGIPEGYKALLFNRYMKDAYSVENEIGEFKKFYEKYYG